MICSSIIAISAEALPALRTNELDVWSIVMFSARRLETVWYSI